MSLLAIWLCGTIPTVGLVRENPPRGVGEYTAALLIVALWPFFWLWVFGSFLLKRGEQ